VSTASPYEISELTHMANAIGSAIREAIANGVPPQRALDIAACILVTEARKFGGGWPGTVWNIVDCAIINADGDAP
jgi:hypothetical protein